VLYNSAPAMFGYAVFVLCAGGDRLIVRKRLAARTSSLSDSADSAILRRYSFWENAHFAAL